MSNVHAKGMLLGAMNNNRISIRADGSAMLDISEHAHKSLPTSRDRLPPELWKSDFDSARIPSDTPSIPQTDVFQLGYAMWLIAEHRPGSWGYYCKWAVCPMCLATSVRLIMRNLQSFPHAP